MTPLGLLTAFCACAGFAHAQYFSQGWAPGQPVPSVADFQAARPASASVVPPTGAGGASQEGGGGHKLPKQGLLDTLVTNGPVSALSGLLGLNLSGAPAVEWDARIPLITDENYDEVIVNEEMDDEEAMERVWFLVVTVTAGSPEGVSKFVDDVFDKTYNLTLDTGDLPHVRFGRIDYINVTAITTKWNMWSAPWLVVLKDRGRTLRFYRAGQQKLTPEMLYDLLKDESWRARDPWHSIYGPGGQREWALDYLATVLAAQYRYINKLPKWVLYILSGGVVSVVINFLHKPDAGKNKGEQKQGGKTTAVTAKDKKTTAVSAKEPPPAAPAGAGTSTGTGTSQSRSGTPSKGASKRKNKK
ncbi:hypothetical protein CONPUDRAFT_111124 [Coniophora puteana RWD-64-598 SS2]|uniref:Thioredoxin domain-containing protein n=1 Tax=Coniophora puteana (strain RWD-64-598) TaxID=741705 RepID=A0A5M3MBT2_CONPW|nr:uncharacterized protein CONPUDRAFT_111124 [Coniophora puteana RWD-64-598 SS2]EIW76280.1 hypothetical protein CONPUDRAFT_111124 [Coniophora puteana RWD-64-598 SS2]